MMREASLLIDCQDVPPPRPALTRSCASARLPSVEELSDVCLKPTLQKRHCMPPSDLHEHISRVHPKGVVRERQWNAIQLRCQTHAEEAIRLDRRGRTCLHAACAKNPPLAVIHALVSASDEGVLVKADNHGRTPLAIAVSSGADPGVIEFLLKSEPQAASMEDHLGRMPLHLACIGYDFGQVDLVKLLLEANAKACSHESSNGRIPLIIAIEGGAPVEVIDLLVQSCPEAVEMNGCGMNSLFVAVLHNPSPPIIQTLVRAWPQVTSSRDAGGAYPLRLAMEKRSSTAIIECLCTSPEIVVDTDDHMKNTVLHTAFEYGVPRESIVRLLLRMASQVSTQACRSGHTPLTLACQKYVQLSQRQDSHTRSIWNIVSMLLQASKYGSVHPDVALLLDQHDFVVHAAVSMVLPKEVVMTTLTLYPDQARVPDCHGKYPIQLALSSPYEEAKSGILLQLLEQHPEAAALLRQDDRSMLAIAAMCQSVDERVVARLVQANPAALRELDPRVGLYPFQLAALEKSNAINVASDLHPRIEKEWNGRIDQDLVQSSVIFQLLRAAPDLLGAQTIL